MYSGQHGYQLILIKIYEYTKLECFVTHFGDVCCDMYIYWHGFLIWIALIALKYISVRYDSSNTPCTTRALIHIQTNTHMVRSSDIIHISKYITKTKNTLNNLYFYAYRPTNKQLRSFMNLSHHTSKIRVSRTLPIILPPELYQVSIAFFKDGESTQDATFYSIHIEKQAAVLFQIKNIS